MKNALQNQAMRLKLLLRKDNSFIKKYPDQAPRNVRKGQEGHYDRKTLLTQFLPFSFLPLAFELVQCTLIHIISSVISAEQTPDKIATR